MDTQYCSTCGHKVQADDVFCSSCGSRVRGHASSTVPKESKRQSRWLPLSIVGAALTIGAAAYLISSRQDPGASQQPPPTAVTQTPTSLDLSVEATSTSAGASTSYTDAQLAEKFGDAVYRIEVSGCGSVGSGSGFAIDPHHVVTNQHVVNEDIEPTLVHRDGSRLQGRVIGWQFDPDIAVIEVSTTLPTSLTWAATSTLTLGDRVLGLGYPVPETDFSAIPGTIISFDDYQGIRRAIRTNATWDYGNSGGPALTETGEIAGVVTQFAANDGRQEVLLAFTPAVLEGPVADMIAFPSDVTSGCATAGEAQFEPGYIEGLEDYYPDPANPFWTAILMSVDYFTEDPNKAFDRAYEVLGLGLPVGLLVSDDFPSLRPGYLVVYSGRFATADDAKSWCAQISPIVGSCYHRNVGWDASYR